MREIQGVLSLDAESIYIYICNIYISSTYGYKLCNTSNTNDENNISHKYTYTNYLFIKFVIYFLEKVWITLLL